MAGVHCDVHDRRPSFVNGGAKLLQIFRIGQTEKPGSGLDLVNIEFFGNVCRKVFQFDLLRRWNRAGSLTPSPPFPSPSGIRERIRAATATLSLGREGNLTEGWELPALANSGKKASRCRSAGALSKKLSADWSRSCGASVPERISTLVGWKDCARATKRIPACRDRARSLSPDLLRREPAATNAAPPARRRSYHGPGQSFDVGAPGSHQFAATLRTPSFNHRLMSLEILLLRYSVISFVVLTGTAYAVPVSHKSRQSIAA